MEAPEDCLLSLLGVTASRPREGQPCLFPWQCLAISRWSGSPVDEARSRKCSPAPLGPDMLILKLRDAWG